MSPDKVVHDESMLNLITLGTRTMTIGEQDTIPLMCIHDFKDWNHQVLGSTPVAARLLSHATAASREDSGCTQEITKTAAT